MTPERAVAIRCCGPFLYPFSTPAPPRFPPFQGAFLRSRNRNHPPSISPQILPSEGDSTRKRRSKSLPVPPNFPQRLPLASPQSNPRCVLCWAMPKAGISSRIGCISKVFPCSSKAPQELTSENCNLYPAAQKRLALIRPLLDHDMDAVTDHQLRLSVSKDIEEARISERVMQRAIDILAIKVPKTYSGGTYISDFEVNDAGANEAPPAQVPAELPRELTAESPEPVPRLYANQRGRKAAATETEYALTEALQRNTLCSFWTFLPRRFSPARPLR